jgi:hypothetical protein
MTQLKRHAPYLSLITLAVVLWFYPFFLRGHILIPPNILSAYPWYNSDQALPPHPQGSMDAVRENYITWAIHDHYLEQGYAPHWQPYFLSGNPLLANQFAIPYSPYKLLNLFLSAPAAWSWAIILKCWLNGLFTYASLRLLGRGYTASTIGALAWMLSWPLAHQTQTTYNEGVAWMSALFCFLLLSLQAQGWRKQTLYALPAALIAGFQFLGGNVQMTIYSALFLGGFALLYPSEGKGLWRWGRPVLTIGAIYALGVVIGAAQWMSSYELLGESIRGVSQTHANKGIEPYTALSFLNPWLYFWQNFEFPELREKYWLNYRWNPYIGLIPFFVQAIVLAWVKDRLARRILYTTLAVFAVLQIVYWRPIFEVISQLPGYNTLDQTRLLIVLSFPLAILSAYGVDWLLEHGPQKRRKIALLLGLAAGVLALAVVGMLALMAYFRDEVLATQDLGQSFAEQRLRIGTEVIADYYRLDNPLFAATLLFGLAGMASIALYSLGRLPRRGMEWALLGLCVADLVLMAHVNIGTTPSQQVYPVTDGITFLQTQMEQAGPFRIGASPNTLFRGRPSDWYSEYRDDHGWFLSSLLPVLTPNTAALYGLQDVRGYESVYTLRYSRYMARMNGQEEPFSALVIPETYRHPMLDALNMRYILSIEPLPDPDLRLVYQGDLWIYENPNALGRLQFYDSLQVLPDSEAVLAAISAPTFDPQTQVYLEATPAFDPSTLAPGAASAIISLYEPSRIVIAAQTETPQLLLLSEVVYPGWQAYLDGQPVPTWRANYLFRAIYLPAGVHQVEFRYESRVIAWGERLSFIGVLGIVGLAGYLWWGLRRQKSHSSP